MADRLTWKTRVWEVCSEI